MRWRAGKAIGSLRVPSGRRPGEDRTRYPIGVGGGRWRRHFAVASGAGGRGRCCDRGRVALVVAGVKVLYVIWPCALTAPCQDLVDSRKDDTTAYLALSERIRSTLIGLTN